jgi:hypothetical protein
MILNKRLISKITQSKQCQNMGKKLKIKILLMISMDFKKIQIIFILAVRAIEAVKCHFKYIIKINMRLCLLKIMHNFL